LRTTNATKSVKIRAVEKCGLNNLLFLIAYPWLKTMTHTLVNGGNIVHLIRKKGWGESFVCMIEWNFILNTGKGVVV